MLSRTSEDAGVVVEISGAQNKKGVTITRNAFIATAEFFGRPCGARTCDQRIKSPLGRSEQPLLINHLQRLPDAITSHTKGEGR
jgi:hypothetical protein